MREHLVGQTVIMRGMRLYRPFMDFLIAYDCLAVTLYHLTGRPISTKLGNYGLATANRFPLQVKHPTSGLAKSALTGFQIDGFPIEVGRTQAAAKVEDDFETTVFQSLVMHLISPFFGGYFETYKPWLKHNVSTDVYQWPAVWNFARVVRNATFHEGKISWHNVNAPAVSWEGIDYSSADNGREVIGSHLTLGDLLILMLEMDKELHRLGHQP